MAKPYGRLYQKGKNVSIMGIDTYDVWPVGSVYISTNSTNPSVYFGGTWVQTCKSRCLMGAGANDANTDNGWGTFAASSYNFGAGARIGEHHHTLSSGEMPWHSHSFTTFGAGSHQHRLYLNGDPNFPFVGHPGWNGDVTPSNAAKLNCGSGSFNGYYFYAGHSGTSDGWHQHTGNCDYTGGSGEHNNMPPGEVFYIWKRTA